MESEFDALVSALRGGLGRRYDAITRLCEYGEPAIAHLLRRLRDGDARTRYAIARAFTSMGWPPDFEERADVAEALLAALDDEYAPVRHRAARALERFCEPRTAAVLAHWLPSADATDRYRAQCGLHQASMAALCRALDDPSVEARRSAAATLARLRSCHRHTLAKMVDRLANDPDDEVRGSAARYLAVFRVERPDVLELLQAKLKDPRAGYWTRLGAAEGITSIATGFGIARVLHDAPQIIDVLETVLTDRHSTVRNQAIAALGAIGGPRVPDLIAWLVYDRDPGVRVKAVSTLVALRVPGVLGTACALLREDPHYFVREWAALALAEFDDAQAADALRAALGDVNEHVRLAAIKALAAVAGADALDDLRAASLSDRSAYNRDVAARAVRNLGGKVPI